MEHSVNVTLQNITLTSGCNCSFCLIMARKTSFEGRFSRVRTGQQDHGWISHFENEIGLSPRVSAISFAHGI